MLYAHRIIVYHGTTASRAVQIKREGFKESAEAATMGRGVYFGREKTALVYAVKRASVSDEQPAILKAAVSYNRLHHTVYPKRDWHGGSDGIHLKPRAHWCFDSSRVRIEVLRVYKGDEIRALVPSFRHTPMRSTPPLNVHPNPQLTPWHVVQQRHPHRKLPAAQLHESEVIVKRAFAERALLARPYIVQRERLTKRYRAEQDLLAEQYITERTHAMQEFTVQLGRAAHQLAARCDQAANYLDFQRRRAAQCYVAER